MKFSIRIPLISNMKDVNICVVFLLLSVANGLNLPKYIKTCKLKSADFKECAIKNGNEAIPYIVKGDRHLGFPSFLPFRISSVTSSSLGLNMNLTNATFSGVENLKLLDFEFDPVKRYSSMTTTCPLLIFDFDYATSGKIASLPIEGKGHGWAKFINGNYTYAYQFDVKSKNGKHYMVIGKDKITIEPEIMQSDLGNLFNGDKLLGDNLNKFLNENWRELLAEFSPTITEVFGAIGREILGKLYDKIPLEEIFPDITF